MEISKFITTKKETIDVSRIHTMVSLGLKMNRNSSTIYMWKLKGALETVFISGVEFVLEPENIEDFKPQRVKRRQGV